MYDHPATYGTKKTIFDFPIKTDAQYALIPAIAKGDLTEITRLATFADITQHGHASPPLHQAAAQERLIVVTHLLALKADANARNYLGETPIFKAARSGNIAMAQALQDAGAELNHETPFGMTPLECALKGLPGIDQIKQLAMIEWLLKHGARLAQNRPQLAIRCQNAAAVQQLLERLGKGIQVTQIT